MQVRAFVVVTAIATGCVPADDDGFHARLAGGCATEAECDALRKEALLRITDCSTVDAITDARGCKARMGDFDTATSLRTAVLEKERSAAAAKESQRAAEVTALATPPDPCVDAGPEVAFCCDVRKGREDRVRIDGMIRWHLARRPFGHMTSVVDGQRTERLTETGLSPSRSVADPTAFPRGARRDAHARAEAPMLRRRGGGATRRPPPSMRGRRSGNPPSRRRRRAARHRSVSRIAPRSLPAKQSPKGRRRWRTSAREKRNPSGYVDMRLLHDLGDDVQADDDAIRELRARYLSVAHRPFNESACPK